MAPISAQQRLNYWNQRRSSLPGINSKQLPSNATLQQTATGRYLMQSAGGQTYALDTEGRIRGYSRGDREARYDQNGHLQMVRTPGMLIRRRVSGERRVESAGPNGVYVVSSGVSTGFVERPVTVGRATLVQRTTLAGGTASVSYYRSISYRGLSMEEYLPATVYAPGFYLWLQSRWSVPVVNQPALVPFTVNTTYRSYFQPEASYSSPAMLLVDQVIAAQLTPLPELTRQTEPGGEPAPSTYSDLPQITAPDTTPVSHEIKAEVAQQFGQILRMDSQLAQIGPNQPVQAAPAMLDPTIKFYFVDETLEVRTARGDHRCSLTRGDALHLALAVPNAVEADLLVASGVKGDCPAGSHVMVNITDLQAMNNHCHELLSAAADKVATQNGQNGLPAAPPSDLRPAVPGLQTADQGKLAAAVIAAQQAQALTLQANAQADAQSGLK